jgi:hypothetical protein
VAKKINNLIIHTNHNGNESIKKFKKVIKFFDNSVHCFIFDGLVKNKEKSREIALYFILIIFFFQLIREIQ